MDGEKLLVESNRDGAFLVRSSDTVKGAYVLSIMLVLKLNYNYLHKFMYAVYMLIKLVLLNAFLNILFQ